MVKAHVQISFSGGFSSAINWNVSCFFSSVCTTNDFFLNGCLLKWEHKWLRIHTYITVYRRQIFYWMFSLKSNVLNASRCSTSTLYTSRAYCKTTVNTYENQCCYNSFTLRSQHIIRNKRRKQFCHLYIPKHSL